MSSIFRDPRRLAGVLVLVAAGADALGGMAVARLNEGPARCELRVERGGGTVTLTALAEVEETVNGTYALRVSGRGTNIRQGGPFQAAPGRPATLGTVTLSANGASYEADLDLLVGGETLSCTKRFGGGL